MRVHPPDAATARPHPHPERQPLAELPQLTSGDSSHLSRSAPAAEVTPTAYRILCLRFVQIVFVLFPTLLSPLPTGPKTRYGLLARSYPAPTFTLQETPSSLGAITLCRSADDKLTIWWHT